MTKPTHHAPPTDPTRGIATALDQIGRAIEDYAAVFHQESPENEESRVSAAIERCLHWDREGK